MTELSRASTAVAGDQSGNYSESNLRQVQESGLQLDHNAM